MATYAYGKFRIPTAAHDKLFALSECVVVDSPASDYHLTLLAEYSGLPVQISYEAELLSSSSTVVLGSGDELLGCAIKRWCAVQVQYMPVTNELISSTQVRRELIAGATDEDLVEMGLQATLDKAAIARKLWLAGY